jgi:tetratricopeptide (TPR) repeat protein
MKQGIKEVIYSMKIECLICLKNYEEAEKFIQELIDLNKDYPMAYFHRAVIKFNTLYFKEALDELNKCIEVAEKVDMRHPQYYFLKAEILKKFNDNSYKEFEKTAKKLEKENIERFKSLIKESGMNIRDFKKEFGIK